MIRRFEKPTQVQFKDIEGNLCGGIAYEDFIICGCCGGIVELEEVEDITEYSYWVDISTEILGE